jgi:hypothetical protein
MYLKSLLVEYNFKLKDLTVSSNENKYSLRTTLTLQLVAGIVV